MIAGLPAFRILPDPNEAPRLSADSINCASQSGARVTSLLRIATQSDFAAAIPRFTAAAKPRFAPSRNTRTPKLSATSAESSQDPLSATMISSNGSVWTFKVSSSVRNSSDRFQCGITAATLTRIAS